MRGTGNCFQPLLESGISQDLHSSLVEDMRSGGIRTASMPRNDKRLDAQACQVQGSGGPRRPGADDENWSW
jgi:hypothetical protein